MKLLRTLAAAAAVLAAGACADAPTETPVPADAPRAAVTASQAVGEIRVAGVVEYSDRWLVYFDTGRDFDDPASYTWTAAAPAVGDPPYGNHVYKFWAWRSKSLGPGCIAVQLRTTLGDGSNVEDVETVPVGRHVGTCSAPW